ncbi:CdaR family protein [Paenibacillus dendritiformis]|uniref:YbbR family protein n=1 Tax=Paenibacillus dendritiformis C454 TaxID=1131935 RepID=H3SK92_9BACL|nr:CdaR family protein [Paenibacillus dendritiformis]EHQ60512.1 YbbR family protein [Paenibacillus dendritiformis C454]CAH8773163.1 CdaR family protein [Paenibacillus dendritiformis]
MDKWLMNNTSAKVIALLIGVLLFIVVHKDDPTSVSVPPLMETRWIDNVQVRTVGLDTKQQVIQSITPDSVRIQVRGKRTTIAAALPENYKVILDLTGYGPGTHVVQLQHDFPPGIELQAMEPSSVKVELEDVQTKEFEIQVRTQGAAAQGYKPGTPIVSPSNRVHVTLPASRMTEVAAVSAAVNIEGANESVIAKRVKLTAYNDRGQEIEDAVITPSVVEIEVPITKPFKTVPLQLDLVGQLPDGLAVSSLMPSVNQITLYGPQEALNKVEFFDGVQVNLKQIDQAGQYKLDVTLTPPPNIEKIEPSEITVDVIVSAVKQKVITGVPITLTGENDRLETAIVEPATRKLDVAVVGAPNLIDEMTASDIQLIANVNDLPAGTHTINVQVNLPRFVRRAEQTPLTVTVEIRDKGEPVTTDPAPEGGGESDNGTHGATEGNRPDTDTTEPNGSNHEEDQTPEEETSTDPGEDTLTQE